MLVIVGPNMISVHFEYVPIKQMCSDRDRQKAGQNRQTDRQSNRQTDRQTQQTER